MSKTKIYALWIWAAYFYHGWWKVHPAKWQKKLREQRGDGRVDKAKGVLVDSMPVYKLVDKNKKRGTPIHYVQCKVCKESWYTTCKRPLCKRLACWISYYK